MRARLLCNTLPSGLQTTIGGSTAVASPMKGESDPIIYTEIRRLRIKFQLGKCLACPALLLQLIGEAETSPVVPPQKKVHFASQEVVHVYERSVKPTSLLYLGDETETETDDEYETDLTGFFASIRNTGRLRLSLPEARNCACFCGQHGSP